MAIPTERDLVRIGPWPQGSNNLSLATSVPRRSFRKGVNVDVTDDGKVVRREGRTKLVDGKLCGLFGYGRRGFYLEGSTLYGFEVDGDRTTQPVALYDGLALEAQLAHSLVEPDIFVSDGSTNLRIRPDNSVSPWSIPTPAVPSASVEPDGALAAGRYHGAIAFKASTGEEGPLSSQFVFEVEEGQRVVVNFAQTIPEFRTVLYMTKPNGTELLHVATLPPAPSVNVHRHPLGRPPSTLYTDPMPPARFAATWNGRLLVGASRFVTWSEALHYGVTKSMYNYLELSEEITMIAAVDTAGGFFIGQKTRTLYMAGEDPADANQVVAYPFGVIPGTMHMVPGARLPMENAPAKPVPMWLASNGVFCVGLEDGTVHPLTEPRFATQLAEQGAALFDQRGGKSRFLTALRDPSPNNFAVSDSFTAEVVRPSDN